MATTRPQHFPAFWHQAELELELTSPLPFHQPASHRQHYSTFRFSPTARALAPFQAPKCAGCSSASSPAELPDRPIGGPSRHCADYSNLPSAPRVRKPSVPTNAPMRFQNTFQPRATMDTTTTVVRMLPWERHHGESSKPAASGTTVPCQLRQLHDI